MCYADALAISRFEPRYFEKNIESGIPILTMEGRKAVEEELRESSLYILEGCNGGNSTPS